jgi:hypothetical protein
MDRQELRMHVGDVQQREIAERRQVVERGSFLRDAGFGPQPRARRGGEREQLQEVAALQPTG